MKRLPALGALVALILAGSAAAFAPPNELVVVSDDSYPPYLFRIDSGYLQGIIVDRWALWSRRTGIPVSVVGMAWAHAQESVRDGSADVIDALAYTKAREQIYEFSPPYADVDARVFFQRSIGGINNDVASMRGFTVGAKDGSACAAWLEERGIATLRRFATSDAVVEAAHNREVPLFCMDLPVAQYLIYKQRLAEEFRQTEPLYTAQFHWAVAKGRAELRDFIQRGFERVSEDELRAIESRWTGNPLRLPIDPRYFYYLAAGLASLLAAAVLLAAWNRTLSLRVAAKTSELRGALDSLRIQADKVRDLYDNAPCGYHSLDADGVFVEINDTELEWLGYSRDEVVGKLRFTDLLTEEGRKAFAENFERFKELGHTRDLSYELIRKGGTRMSVLMSASLVRAPDGSYLMSRATLYDVTEWNQAVLALKESEERFERMFQLSPDAIVVTSVAEGRVIEANEAFLRIVDRKREEAIGRTTAELGFWRDAQDRAAMLVLPTTNGGLREYQRAVRVPAGEERDLLVRASRIDLQGRPALFTIIQDITERRRAERLLEESEQRLAKMVEASPEAITIASIEDGTFISVNPAGERLGGYTREEMIGRSALDLGFWPDPEERKRLIADVQRNEAVHGREIHLRRKDGKVRDVLASAAMIEVGGRKLMLFQGIDITERKNAEKALREHEVLLRELSAHHDSVREEERARIAREIHDEMGQALTALKMDLSVLGLESAKKAPRVAEQIRELKGRVDDIIQLVRDVATALRPAALDLGILPGIEWLVDEFQKRNGIPCHVTVEDGEIDLAEDRGIVLFRILQESLTNIARHADARKVEISLRRDATHVRLDVKDDGRGFDPEAARKKKTFGLLGIRERVIMLDGHLTISSVPGEGTQVSVSIPL